ncbi:Predicted arabinose efflux permease, MFS family [Paracoccus isoporae]|uniref:Predicted arabinose efflux permease, MFS family n=1 Tax=Paracoccus isoporae TaxID=591205 RepID=A0A1G7A840_9RHOB|nr:MFS transporter [Paracoccus isoporae]SDE10833.1 Predicted arabinose efflux permease, MFS family [Paracoccus isoporae]
MRRAWRNVAVLVIAQALMGAQMPMIFTVGGLAGQMLSPNPCLATLPISMVVLATALSARPLAGFMQRHGRRAGFQVGAVSGAVGAAVSMLGLWQGSFVIYLAGHVLTGVYMASQGFFRFAATDTAPDHFAPRAISFVLAGGLASAFVALGLLRVTDGGSAIPFLLSYAAIIGLNLVGFLVFFALDIPRPPAPEDGAAKTRRSAIEILRDPRLLVPMICAMVSYALMNLVMTSTPLAMVGCGLDRSQAGDVVFAHVLAMFVPSFFTGHLINRFGAALIVGTGLAILAAAGAVGLSGVALGQFYVTLILLGIGWNFGFIGATTMLARAHAPEERGQVQGINDLVVFGGVFMASLASGGLMNCSGALSAESGWDAVNMAMAPLLVLAGGALIWLRMRPKEA